jgi:beta-ribofuranosylaminobenzene 5'-phosphate synthase
MEGNTKKKGEMKVFNRIHVNSIEMSKRGALDSGGIGFSIDYSPMNVCVRKLLNNKVQVSGYERRRVLEILSMLNKVLKISPLGWEVLVDKNLNSHLGLGSTTQIDAAISHLIGNISQGINLNTEHYYQIGIGRESGVGLKCFLNPGFHIDFGYLTQKIKGVQTKIKPIEKTISLTLPHEWKVLLAIPKLQQSLSGPIEDEFWKKVLPINQQEAKEIAYWILMGLIPAIKERDYFLFLYSMNKIVSRGSKPAEINLNAKVAGNILNTLRKETGFGGLSSLGPSCYSFINQLNFNEGIINRIRRMHPNFNFEIANIVYA